MKLRGLNVRVISSKKNQRLKRSVKHPRWPQFLALASILLLGTAGFFLFFSPSSPGPKPAKAVAASHAANVPAANKGFLVVSASRTPTPNADRVYYIISNGVHSKRQLSKAIASDPVVARQYANFNLHKLRFIHLRRGRYAYVSYRIGDMTFWTKNKVRIYAGETLITDGTHYGRARCGNRLSEVPRKPVSSWQPSEQQLGAPDLPIVPASLLLPAPLHFSLRPQSPVGSDGPIFPPIFLPPGGGVGHSPPILPVLPSQPTSAPEPGTLLLLSCGLALLFVQSLWNLLRG